MADTIRTLAELNQIFKDTVTPDVSTQDIRDFIRSQLVHAQIGVVDNAVVKTLNPTYSGNGIDVFNTELHSRHITTDLVNSRLTMPPELTTAKYVLSVELNIQGQGASNDGDFTFALFKNQATKIGSTERTISVPTSGFVQASWSVIGQTLAANDTIEMAAIADTGNKDLLIVNGSIGVQRLGIE